MIIKITQPGATATANSFTHTYSRHSGKRPFAAHRAHTSPEAFDGRGWMAGRRWVRSACRERPIAGTFFERRPAPEDCRASGTSSGGSSVTAGYCTARDWRSEACIGGGAGSKCLSCLVIKETSPSKLKMLFEDEELRKRTREGPAWGTAARWEWRLFLAVVCRKYGSAPWLETAT